MNQSFRRAGFAILVAASKRLRSARVHGRGVRPVVVRLALAFAAVLSPLDARAEIPARQLIIGVRAHDRQFELFIDGLESGVSWANSKAGDAGHAFYCLPERFSLSVDQTVELMERFLNRTSPKEDGPAGSVLLNALQDQFPCK